MRRLSIFLAHIVVIVSLAAGTGAHWVVLQSVAWTHMLIDYSRSTTLAVAVEKTFDGKHPCSLCLTIESAEKQQQHQQATQPASDIKGVIPSAPLATMVPALATAAFPLFEQTAESLAHSPPVPPPRLA